MSNILDNGTVLPSGLLAPNGYESAIASFNTTYRNTAIRAGIVVYSYAPDDPLNTNKLCMEYDVLTFQQFENKGTTPILYRHCLSSQGLGSIADYLEFTLRSKTVQTVPGFPTFKNQDGAIALIQCLDGVGEKAIVVGNLIHPDRPTNITSTDPQLFFEYNGVKAQILPDGSLSVSFNGATDNQGNPTDSSQGTTTWQIKTDGSYEFKNAAVGITADISSSNLNITVMKDCNLTTQGDIVAMCKNLTVTASGDSNITASGNAVVDGSAIKLGKNASEALILGKTFKMFMETQLSVSTALGPSGPLIAPLPPTNLSQKSSTE